MVPAAYGGSVQVQECVGGRSTQYWHVLYATGSGHPFIRSWHTGTCMSHRPPIVQKGQLGLEHCTMGYNDRRWGVVFVG